MKSALGGRELKFFGGEMLDFCWGHSLRRDLGVETSDQGF